MRKSLPEHPLPPTPARSRIMRSIRGKDTAPELLVRSALHRSGFRFRVNVRALPGCPDIVLPKHKTVIFVHGCFWHLHIGCLKSSLPKRNRAWWVDKLRRNRARDRKAHATLTAMGWRVIVVWECELPTQPEAIDPNRWPSIVRRLLQRGRSVRD